MPQTLEQIATELEVTIDQLPEELSSRVLRWTHQLCDSLTENYRMYHRNMISANSQRYEGEMSDYAKKQLAEMDNGTAKLMKFVIKNGRKYYKIMQHDFDTFQDRNEYREASVHAFVDKKTGQVYKPASYNAPAKHVRFDMRIINQREICHNPMLTTWAGGWLYLR